MPLPRRCGSPGEWQIFHMTVISTWWKQAGGALILLLPADLAFAQAGQTAPAPKKPATKHSTGQTASSKKSTHTGTAKSRTTSTASSSHKGKKNSKRASRRGQEKIDSERTRQIQEALIRQHYMSGEAT